MVTLGEVCLAKDGCQANPCPAGIECLPDADSSTAYTCLCPENHKFVDDTCAPIIPDIEYKLLDSHELMWRSGGRESNKVPLSIWRVNQYQMDFCSPGDMAIKHRHEDEQLRVDLLAKYCPATVDCHFTKAKNAGNQLLLLGNQLLLLGNQVYTQESSDFSGVNYLKILTI